MTINRVLVHSIENFYNLGFLPGSDPILAICPDPVRADNLSSRLTDRSIKPMTIAQFVKDIIKKYSPDNSIHRKSQLFMELSMVWKKAGGARNFNAFNQAFNLFTDYRGFTTDIGLIEEILAEHPDSLSQALRWFYAYMEIQGILDEQAGYKLAAELIKNNQHTFGNIIFVGFSHFSAQQLELLGAVGETSALFIPSFKKTETDLSSTDWQYWLDAMGAEKIPVEEEDKIRRASIGIYPKGYLSSTMAGFEEKDVQVLFFDKNPSILDILELDLSKGYFKVSADIFQSYFREVEKAIWNEQWFHENLEYCVTNKNFTKVKFFLSLKEILAWWREISAENIEPDEFDRKVLLEILRLDLPRMSNLPVGKEVWNSQILDLSRIDTLNPEVRTIVCVKNKGLSFSNVKEPYSETVKSFLVAMGPVRNIKRERLELQCHIEDLLNRANVNFLIEEGTLDENVFWNELCLESPEAVELEGTSDNDDYLAQYIKRRELNIGKMSASKMQTFLDCPRKYYFTYLDNWNIRQDFQSRFSSFELGLISHEVIEVKMTSPRKPLEEILDESLTKYSQDRSISKLNLESSRIKLLFRIKNGLEFLEKLKILDPTIQFQFERSLTGADISGRIDCLWESEIIGSGIIDFKSSGFGIPTKKDHLEFKKIQLWFYLAFGGIEPVDIKLWGFLNLDDIDNSLLFSDGTISLDGIKLNNSEVPDLKTFLGFYSEFKERILKEEKYPALPISSSACTYCHLANLCPKGGSVGI